MPTQREHRLKYNENRLILDTLFDKTNKAHSNWITTISFYTALHIVEYVFAKQNIDCKSHSEREEKMLESGLFDIKIISKYKWMGQYSRIARYKKDNISPTLAEKSLQILKEIEDKYNFPREST